MKILILQASPRANGNTVWMAEEYNLTSIGADAMCKTDDMVLNIMTSKTSKPSTA